MNYEIDLRSPECRNHAKILKPKTARILLYLLALGLIIAFCYAAEDYKLKLRAESDMLKTEMAAKTEAAAPLIAMSAEIETYKRRLNIAETLLSGYPLKIEYLRTVKKAASPGLKLSYLAIDAEGKLDLSGSGSTLQSAARFARKLQDLPFISKSELTAADLHEDTGCVFSIRAELKQAAGVGNHE
jgi:hypothetical protein